MTMSSVFGIYKAYWFFFFKYTAGTRGKYIKIQCLFGILLRRENVD